MDVTSFILLLGISFLSAIIGTMVGMAMLIMPPVMIFFGVPVHAAIATARFSMVGQHIGNITKFSLKDRMQSRYVLPFAIAGVIGSIFGASFLIKINEELLKNTIGIFMIIISILILFEDFINPKERKPKITIKRHLLSVLGGLFIGGYLGIIGGGGATLIILLLALIYGLSFHDAIANQKAVTFPISIITTLIFIYQGLIDYNLGVPLFLANVIGGWLGAGLILKFKNIWLKRILVPVIVIMALKLIFF